MTDSFVFYRSFQECLEHVDDAAYRRIMTAITTYALNGETPSLQGLELAVFIAIKPQIDANIKRRENGKLGGKPTQVKTPQDCNTHTYIEETGTNQAEPNLTKSNQAEPRLTKANQSEPNPNQAEPNVNANENENVNVNENVFFTAAEKTVMLFLPEQERIVAQLRDIWHEHGMPFFNADVNTSAKQQVILHFKQDPAYVIAAIQNAAQVQKLIDAKQSWRDKPIGFNSFCEHFSEYVRESFVLERYFADKGKQVKPAAAVIDNAIFDDPAEVERRLAELYKQAEADSTLFDDPAEAKQQLTVSYAHG